MPLLTVLGQNNGIPSNDVFITARTCPSIFDVYKKLQITPEIVEACKAWQAQPSARGIMAEARERCKGLKTLKQVAIENNIDYWKLHKYLFRSIH